MIREVRLQFSQTHALQQSSDYAPLADRRTETDAFESDRELLFPCLEVVWPGLNVDQVGAGRGQVEQALQLRYGYEAGAARALVSGFLTLHERFHGHWDVVLESALRRWPRVNVSDFAGIEGTVTSLTGLLVDRYELSKAAARSDLMSHLRDLHFPTLLCLAPTGLRYPRAGRSVPDDGRQTGLI